MLDYHRTKEFQIRNCRVILSGHATEWMLAADVVNRFVKKLGE